MNRLGTLLIGIGILLIIAAVGISVNYNDVVNALPPAVQVRLPDFGDAPDALPKADTQASAAEVAELLALPDETVVVPTPTPTHTHTPLPSPTATATDIPPTAEPSATATPTPTDTPTATPTFTPSPTPTATPTPTPLPASNRIEGIFNIPQTFNNCGPANLSINLIYHQDQTTQQEVAAYLKPNPNDRNVSPWQISDYVNDYTSLSSTVHSGGDMAMLKRLIANGFPVVIERGIDFNDGNGWYGHYLTLFGYDDAAQSFMAMDTYASPWAPNGEPFSYEDVETSWQHFNYTFYVVFPDDQLVTVNNLIGLELLQPRSMWDRTLAIAQAQIEENPDDKWAWFNLGTSYTELGKMTGDPFYYEKGAAAFDQARTYDLPYRMLWYQFRPYMAYYRVGRTADVITLADVTLTTRGGQNVEETYLWKGHATAASGDIEGARALYEEALKFNKNFYPAQTALDSLNG